MISNPGTVLSRVLETVTEPGPRIEKLRKVAAVLRETAGFRWVGLYDVDHAKGEVINLVWAGPSAPAYPVFPTTKGLTSAAIAEKRTINVGDVHNDPRNYPSNSDLLSFRGSFATCKSSSSLAASG